MERTVQYGQREPVRTVAISTNFNLRDVTTAATRLRSWAMTRGVEVSGPPFLRLTGGSVCRVHVPVSSEVAPHPETGFEFDRASGGETATLEDIRFGEVRALGHELTQALRVSFPDGYIEFHSLDGEFVAGDVLLVAEKLQSSRPSSIALPGAPEDGGPEHPAGPVPVRVITVSRQHGSGGEAIAVAVAQQLGYRMIDYGILQRAALEAKVSPETIREAAQHKGLFARILDAMSRMPPAYADGWTPPVQLSASPLYTSAEYRAFVEDSIREVAEQGDVLILGHGAQLVLAKRADTLRVLITGSLRNRTQRAMDSGMDAEDAEREVRTADNERQAYFRDFYKEGWLDPATYDIVINTDRVSRALAAMTISELAGRREGLALSPRAT
jgi:cytidylate kinase